METCIIKIHLASNKSLFIISAYYPSGNNDEYLKIELQKLFELMNIDNLNNYYILAGDLNCKHVDWSNSINNSKGLILDKWLNDNSINFRCSLISSVYPSFPRSRSFIDLCILDHRLNFQKQNNTINCLKNLSYDSDHDAVQLIVHGLNKHDIFELILNDCKPQYLFKQTNWKKFQKEIENTIENDPLVPNNRNLSNSEIDFHLKRLSNVIISTIDKIVPKSKTLNRIPQFLTPIIVKLQHEKSKLVSSLKKHNRLLVILPPDTVIFLKNKLKLIRKLIHDNFVLAVNNLYETKLRAITTKNPIKMYEEVKRQFKNINGVNINTIKIEQHNLRLLHKADIVPTSVESEPSTNKFIIKDQKQILNVIGSYFEEVHSKKNINTNNFNHRHVVECFEEFSSRKASYESNNTTLINFSDNALANELDIATTSEYFVVQSELISIFANLKGKLSSGIDNIPNIVLKKCPLKIIKEYCSLFNNIINNSYFPNDWKVAKVVVIPKKDKDVTNPKNLRPISLLPNISKIFEICVSKSILNLCEKNGINNENQFGFKFQHSTIHAINMLTSHVNWNLNRKLCTGTCLIDFEKAFDAIWIEGLITKLLTYRFPESFVILLHNMLSEKQFTVCNKNNNSSKKFTLFNGLQQGTVNAPILFNIYIFSLLKSTENIIGYADDIVIYHSDDQIEKINSGLQLKYDIVEQYATDWLMKINVEKCETILFRPPVNKCNHNIKTNWKSFGIVSNLNNTSIQNNNVVKYLGIYLDKFLYFNVHIKNKLISAKNAYFAYKKMFSSRHLNNRVKVVLYQSLIRPILTYGCPIWFNISPSYMEKIRIFERKCLRSCTKLFRTPQSNYTKYYSNNKLYNSSNIIRIDNYIIKLIRNHINNSMNCECNNIIKAPYYVSHDYICTSLLNGFVPAESFLYLDSRGFIQSAEGIPLFYHFYRRATNKSFDENIVYANDIRYDTSISLRDMEYTLSLNSNHFWWLNN